MANGIDAANEFSARWARLRGPRPFVYSGAAVWPLLAALASGAAGAARHELEEAIGAGASEAAEAALEVFDALQAIRGVHAALGLWISESAFPLDKRWVDWVADDMLGVLSGDEVLDQQAVDEWVSKRVDPQAERLVLAGEAEDSISLLSSVLVRTWWDLPFDEWRLQPESGPWAGGWIRTLDLNTADLDRIAVVETPLGYVTFFKSVGVDDIDVYLFLAEETFAGGEVVAAAINACMGEHTVHPGSQLDGTEKAPGLSFGEIAGSDAAGPHLVVTVPSFEVTSRHDLLTIPHLLGLDPATDRNHGHFPGISDERLVVGGATQLARASFDAVGFEQAAVTLIEAASGGAPTTKVPLVQVTIDRPFGFMAMDKESGLVVLAGWVDEPQWVEAPAWAPRSS